MDDAPHRPFSPSPGLAEIAAVRATMRPALFAGFVFSAFVNLLMLTAPLYMLQVYDRVLASRSVETLLALSGLAALLFLLMGLLDHARSRIMARVGAACQAGLEVRVLAAAFRRLTRHPGDADARAAQHDLDAMARFWASPAALALFDLPWTPVFLAALFVFDPWLGWLAIAGGLVLALAAWANQRAGATPQQVAVAARLAADRMADALVSEAEVIESLGMTGTSFARWTHAQTRARAAALAAADANGRWSVFTRTFRLFLQSAILGLAAWLVLREELSAGAMVAASVLMGRALLPVEQAVAHWPTLARASEGKARLAELLARVPPRAPRLALPQPQAQVEVAGLTVCPPGTHVPTLRGVSFSLAPGQAVGVIGPSGAGKSTLARALTGVWPVAGGSIRLGGSTLDQHDPDRLGHWIGYLPQRVALFEGTVGENIARLQPGADPARIIAAARAAAAHDMILHLPRGYDTELTSTANPLSGGQLQRLGLARALFGDPVLLVLDEPNASLDNDGAAALNHAVRAAKARGAVVLIMAHRPAALQECDLLLVLKEGGVAAFGPRDTILREAVRNAGDIARTLQGAGA